MSSSNKKRRSLLFVPGNNEKMLRKSTSSLLDCDYVIFDLEDSVSLDQKQVARDLIVKVLSETPSQANPKKFCVRINQLNSEKISRADIEVFSKVDEISNFVIPKAEDASMIQSVFERSGKLLIPIIESSKGFLKMEEIGSCKGIEAISYGAADMALSMKGSIEVFRRNEYVRTRLAIVARGYGLDPIDQVFFDLNDPQGFRREALEAKNLGYSGKLLIHPNQISVANDVFSYSTNAEIVWAKRVVSAYELAIKDSRERKGAITVDGQLVDAVHYKIAKEILGDSIEDIES